MRPKYDQKENSCGYTFFLTFLIWVSVTFFRSEDQNPASWSLFYNSWEYVTGREEPTEIWLLSKQTMYNK